MKRNQADNIDYLIGWLCGAVFFAAPIVALVYLLRQRRRPAFQAAMVGVLSLACIIGARALMLAAGVQHKRSAWIGLNLLVFIAFPLLATGIASSLPWPRPSGPHAGERPPSRKAPQPARPE